MKKALYTILGGVLAASAIAETTLHAGDLVLVTYNSDNPDTEAFMSLTGFTAGTSFIYTDYGWNTVTSNFRFGGEGYIKATATRDFAPGEVFVITSDSTGIFNTDFTYEYDPGTGTPQFAPATAGDQIFIFQGTIDDAGATWTGELLFGLNADGGDANSGIADLNGWSATAAGSNNSGLPPTLTPGLTAIGMVRPASSTPEWAFEYDNYTYVGTRTGTRAELQAAICDRANWVGSDDLIAPDTTAFTIQSGNNVNISGTLQLNDTLGALAFNRPISYAIKQGANTIVSGSWSVGNSSTPFSISIPASANGAATLELDGSSFLIRKAALNLTGAAVSMGNVTMQNGDANQSGEIDAVDIDAVIAAFGVLGDQIEDVDANGEIDATDIDIVIANFGGLDD